MNTGNFGRAGLIKRKPHGEYVTGGDEINGWESFKCKGREKTREEKKKHLVAFQYIIRKVICAGVREVMVTVMHVLCARASVH